MNWKNIIKYIFWGIIIFFSIFGMFVTSIAIHELSHKEDFKGIALDGAICILTIPTNLSDVWNTPGGWYYSNEIINETEYDKVQKFTEYKAYGLSGLFVLGYFAVLVFMVLLTFNGGEKMDTEKDIIKDWEKTNGPRLNQLGWSKKNKALSVVFIILSIVIIILILVALGILLGYIKLPEQFKEIFNNVCNPVINSTSICNPQVTVPANSCGDCICGNVNVTMPPVVINLGNTSV